VVRGRRWHHPQTLGHQPLQTPRRAEDRRHQQDGPPAATTSRIFKRDLLPAPGVLGVRRNVLYSPSASHDGARMCRSCRPDPAPAEIPISRPTPVACAVGSVIEPSSIRARVPARHRAGHHGRCAPSTTSSAAPLGPGARAAGKRARAQREGSPPSAPLQVRGFEGGPHPATRSRGGAPPPLSNRAATPAASTRGA